MTRIVSLSSSAVIGVLLVVMTTNLLIQTVDATAAGVESHREILGRVVDHLNNFMMAPVDALRRAQLYLDAGGFVKDVHASDRSFLSKWLFKELPVYVYFGLEDGSYLYYNDFRTTVPPRPAISYREPGFSGYPTNPVPEDSMKHWVSCLDMYGNTQNCTLPEGQPYVKCIDDCKLEKCNKLYQQEDSQQQGGCSLLSSEEETAACEEATPWCPQYTIETVQPGEELGTVPAVFACIDRHGAQAQTLGGVVVGGTYAEPEFGNCYFLDETTLVNRTLLGEYATCADGSPCTSFIGTYQSEEYDPRYRPWYMDSKQLQKPVWTEPYLFFGDTSIGITYTVPIYTSQESKKIFKGVFAVDYTLEQVRLFLQQYKGSSMLVAVVEATEPNYVVAASTGSFASRVVEESDLTTPCQDELTLIGCTTLRETIHSLNEDPGDLILQKAFRARAQEGFPTSELIYFKEHPDALGDNAYISQGGIFEQPNANLKWHVIVVTPLTPSQSDAASVGTSSFYIILATSMVGFTFCLFLFVSFVKSRGFRAIQNSDWRFTCAFLCGCALLNLSSLALLGENTDGLCMLRMWLFNLLFAMALSPLFVKVWRMHRLFHASRNFKRVRITNLTAILMTLPIILAELLILTTFSFVDPSRAVEELGVADLELGLVQTVTCQHETNAFFTTQAIFHVFLVLIGCYLAFGTRNLDPRFGEAKQLAFAMYNIAVTGLILIIIGRLVEMERTIQLLLQAIGVAWGTMFSSAAFVAPKLLEVQRQLSRRKLQRKSSIHYNKKFVLRGNQQVLVETNSTTMSCWMNDLDEKYGATSSNKPEELSHKDDNEESPDYSETKDDDS